MHSAQCGSLNNSGLNESWADAIALDAFIIQLQTRVGAVCFSLNISNNSYFRPKIAYTNKPVQPVCIIYSFQTPPLFAVGHTSKRMKYIFIFVDHWELDDVFIIKSAHIKDVKLIFC